MMTWKPLAVLASAVALLGALVLSSATSAGPTKYDRSWVAADPQHLPGDTDTHFVLTATAPGNGYELVGAIVNLQNLNGNAEVWLDVDNVQRQQAVVTGTGFAPVSFGSEVVRGGQLVRIEVRAGVPLDIGPNTQVIFTALT